MEKVKSFFKEGSWPIIVLSVVSAILGIIAGPIIETIAPPLFQVPNLLYLTFFINGLIFIIVGVYAITFWNKSIKEAQDTNKQIAELAQKLDVKFRYVSIGRGPSRANFMYAANLIRNARKEILILNYGPVQRIEGKFKYDREATASAERKQYYDMMLQKIQDSLPGEFRFRRIIQLPEKQDLSDVFDPVMADHLRMLAELGTKQPEFVSLKKSRPFFNSTLMIIDRRYILFSVSALDPDDQEYYTKGHFVFDDPVGEFANEFIRFFDRIDAHASLITVSDLPMLKLNSMPDG